MTDPVRTLGHLTVVEDAARVAEASAWLLAATDGPANQVRSVGPDTLEDYARIFHPAHDALGREVRWREIAAANGKIAHPGMQWEPITAGRGAQPGLWEQAPQPDSLPLGLTRLLCEILAQFTRSPDRCWCGVWEGYGYMVGLRSDAALPRLAMPYRSMIVACGPLGAVPEKSFTDGFSDTWGESYRSPSLWWPDDRAWCVATDIDMRATYLGASSACVDRLLGDDRLEVMRVTADHYLAVASDTINRPRPDGRGSPTL